MYVCRCMSVRVCMCLFPPVKEMSRERKATATKLTTPCAPQRRWSDTQDGGPCPSQQQQQQCQGYVLPRRLSHHAPPPTRRNLSAPHHHTLTNDPSSSTPVNHTRSHSPTNTCRHRRGGGLSLVAKGLKAIGIKHAYTYTHQQSPLLLKEKETQKTLTQYQIPTRRRCGRLLPGGQGAQGRWGGVHVRGGRHPGDAVGGDGPGVCPWLCAYVRMFVSRR